MCAVQIMGMQIGHTWMPLSITSQFGVPYIKKVQINCKTCKEIRLHSCKIPSQNHKCRKEIYPIVCSQVKSLMFIQSQDVHYKELFP